MNDSNDAILTDFGLAKYLNEDNVAEFDMLYRIHRAPETLKSNLMSQQSDIYQAGLTIYRLCNGNTHFKSQLHNFITPSGTFDNNKFNEAVAGGKYPDRRSYHPHIPQKLRNYIRKALEVDLPARYTSVLELLNDLASINVQYDWSYTQTPLKFEWTCISAAKEYVVTLSPISDKECSLKTTKRSVDSQSPRNIRDYCADKLSWEQGYQRVKDTLNNDSL